jgi:hypothetical protein
LAIGGAAFVGLSVTGCGGGNSGTAGLPSTQLASSSLKNQPVSTAVNVRDAKFAGGAKGDGITDDTAAFRAALAASSEVFIPPGRYVLKKSSASQVNNIVRNNTHIYGDGKSTVIVNGFNYAAVSGQNKSGDENYNAFQATGITGITIENMAFEKTCALAAFSCNDIVFKNIYVDGFHDGVMQDKGVFFHKCNRVRINNCIFRNMNFSVYLSGDATERSTQCVINASLFENNIPAGSFSYTEFPVGVYDYYADDVVVSNNTFRNIYSSLDNGNTGTGMGYGVYEGDGAANKITITGNTFEFTGNGNKNATAVYINQAVSAEISNNIVKASATARLVNGFLIDSKVTGTTRSVSGNDLTNLQTGLPTFGIYVTGVNAANVGTYNIYQNTITGFSNAVRMDGISAGKIIVAKNTCNSQNNAAIQLSGTPEVPLKFAMISGNKITNGKEQGILFGGYCVSSSVIDNTILDGNRANGSGEEFAAIRFETFSFGSVITGNTIGNSAGGLFPYGVTNASNVSSRIFKDITANNTFVGLSSSGMQFLRFPTTVSTVGIFDLNQGDVVQNTQSVAASGWTCTRSAVLTMTANASNALTQISVSSTAGMLAGDSILICKDANTYDTNYYTPSNWHASTVVAVTSDTRFVIADAIPVNDGTFMAGKAVVKTARLS